MNMSCILVVFVAFLNFFGHSSAQDILGCGGFVKADVDINFSLVEVKLLTKQGSLKYQTDCAPNNGYYYIPLYEKGDYVLRVSPPPGWSFEPETVDLHVDGATDKCSLGQDINFLFKGFGIVGRVISKGSSEGPAGVTLTLKEEGKDGVVQQVASSEGGSFLFSQVLPGQYVIQAAHTAWTFEKASTSVGVVNGNGDIGSSLVVYGYDVKGTVLSEGEPIKGVFFLLFSDTIQSKDVKNCDKSPVTGFTVKAGQSQPLCHMTSQASGEFIFPSLQAGNYKLVPFYKGDHITFDVVPPELTFSVEHKSVVLSEPFQVAGFSVVGHVLWDTDSGKGVAGARILLDGKQQAVTRADGSYHLENMKAGVYTLQVQADHVFFDELSVKVTPNTPQLPNIIAARFSLCGQIQIDQSPDGVIAKQRQVTIQAAGEKSEVTTLTTDINGKFCTQVAPGLYILKPVVKESEMDAGLRLAPLEKEVNVTQKPVFGVLFSQFRATIYGTLKCQEKCDTLEVALLVVGKLEDRHIIGVNDDNTYAFTDLMPGKYRLSILDDRWCWKEKTIEFEVVDQDLTGLDFIHTGYILTSTLSHDISLDFAHEKKEGNVGSFNLSKGVNKFCLKEPGIYKLTVKSCHQFDKDVYSHDTANPSVLTLTAVRHLVEGEVISQNAADDITVTIKSSIEEVGSTTIGPLKAAEMKTTENTNKDIKNENKQQNPVTFTFTYWARSGEKIKVIPKSSDLLFYPASIQLSVHGDKCPGKAAVYQARKGVFITGSIQPALSGVTVTITSHDKSSDPITVETDKNGAYSVGPLHSTTEYAVSASKIGYMLTPVNDKQGHFTAHKLAEVIVKVMDEGGQPLASVLLSLSGGVDYRSNQLTSAEGSMTFPELSPGQYFLRPMMKEYRFEPASKMITVEEGKTQNVLIQATRVAFSCYGSVTSLNSEPEPGVIVESTGLGDCQQYQEESKTEQDGTFRIRGLQPNCEYSVQLKTGEVNQHIERTTPKKIHIKPNDADIRGVWIIAFRRMNQLELSGNVITSPDFLSTLKVQLLREDNVDSALHTVALTTTSFFYLPTLMMDNQKYVVRLLSTLSSASFEYSLPEVSFTANKTYKHFTFHFDAKRKPAEQELAPSSFLVLPLTLLIVAMAYNYEKVMPTLSNSITQIQNFVNKAASSGTSTHVNVSALDTSADASAIKKKVKARRA